MSAVIINDWTMASLGEIADIKTGKLDSNRAEEKGRYPFFTCAPNPLRINDYAFDIEAILLAGNNADGIFHLNYYNGKFNAYQRTYVITAKNSDQLDLSYLFYTLKLSLNLMKSFSQGTSTKFLTMKILFDLEISLPPIEVQKAISKTLSILDAKIKTNQQMNVTLETVGGAVFKRWFVDFEFPNQEGKPYKSSGGEMVNSGSEAIPENWNSGNLLDVCEEITDGSHFSPKEDSHGIRLIATVRNMGVFDFDSDACKRISEKDYCKLVRDGCKPKPNDILFSKDGTMGIVFLCLGQQDLVILSSIAIIRPKTGSFAPFLFFYLKNNETRERIFNGYVSGSALPRIVCKDIKRFQIIIPPDPLIKKFAALFDPFLYLIALNCEETRTLAKIRDLLIPKLMSGKIRVPLTKKTLEAT